MGDFDLRTRIGYTSLDYFSDLNVSNFNIGLSFGFHIRGLKAKKQAIVIRKEEITSKPEVQIRHKSNIQINCNDLENAFVFTSNPPQLKNYTFEQLIEKILKEIESYNLTSLTNSIKGLSFIVNCKGEAVNYIFKKIENKKSIDVLNFENKEDSIICTSILKVFKENCIWSPGYLEENPVNYSLYFKFVILDTKIKIYSSIIKEKK